MFKLFEMTDTGCWLWTGATNKGIGVVSVRRDDGRFHATTVAARMWELTHGAPPTVGRITRSCKAPCCVNPSHLIGETTSDLWRVDESTGCWTWLPKKTTFPVGAITREARRLMWLRVHGDDALYGRSAVVNTCASRALCVNPDHLAALGGDDLWYVDGASGCWLWQDQISRGRPQVSYDGEQRIAARVMYERCYGRPAGEVTHTCGELICVNPAHLVDNVPRYEWFHVTERGCWEWTGSGTKGGYGQIHIGEKMLLTHRRTWELYRGPIPAGLCVRHLVCDNPPCCNPDHLALGTTAENSDDVARKLRGGHRLTHEQADALRADRHAGLTFKVLAEKYGIDVAVVVNIVRGFSYAREGGGRMRRKQFAADGAALLAKVRASALACEFFLADEHRSADYCWFTVTENGCWEWRGARTKHGYGRAWIGDRIELAHRRLWTLAHGPIRKGLHVMHTCDNPPCCNPAHLLLGTPLENARDRTAKLRSLQKLTIAQAEDIRGQHAAGTSLRALARLFDVTHKTVARICARETYLH